MLLRALTRTPLSAVRTALPSARFASNIAESGTKLMAPADGEGNEGKNYSVYNTTPIGYYYGPGAHNYGRAQITSNFFAQYFSAFPDSFSEWYNERHFYLKIFKHAAIMMPFLILFCYQDAKYRSDVKEAKEKHGL
eukprot:GEMP01096559.1.p1 GENE.GEMP01096559.1~~GEMP01096559.1.p1  ORF type:complete len:136 (-),score=15.13 GEMP01096559.1:303-710(-)